MRDALTLALVFLSSLPHIILTVVGTGMLTLSYSMTLLALDSASASELSIVAGLNLAAALSLLVASLVLDKSSTAPSIYKILAGIWKAGIIAVVAVAVVMNYFLDAGVDPRLPVFLVSAASMYVESSVVAVHVLLVAKTLYDGRMRLREGRAGRA